MKDAGIQPSESVKLHSENVISETDASYKILSLRTFVPADLCTQHGAMCD